MQFALFFLFIGLPLVELALLIKLGQSIGFWGVMSVIMLTAVGGFFVLQSHGFSVMRKASEALARGETGFAAMQDGAFVALAGLLLIFPGLIGDLVGMILLVPPLRQLIAKWTLKAMGASVRVETISTRRHSGGRWEAGEAQGEPTGRGGRTTVGSSTMGQSPRSGGPFASGPVIDGEFERVDEKPADGQRSRRTDDDVKGDRTSGRSGSR